MSRVGKSSVLGGLVAGVEFGARMISIEGKQIKLQIWDTVRREISKTDCMMFVVGVAGRAGVVPLHHSVLLQRSSRCSSGVRYFKVKRFSPSHRARTSEEMGCEEMGKMLGGDLSPSSHLPPAESEMVDMRQG